MSNIASTSASRMQKMRERLKRENPDFQKQENKRISEFKKKKKQDMNEAEMEKLRKYERDRKRLQRAKKRSDKLQQSPSNSSQGSVSPYQCPQSLGKAIWRTTRALPKSPRKKMAVLTCLAERAGLSPSAEEVVDRSNANSKMDYSKVRDFYFRPDIVYTCPGMNDCITVWENGIKEKLQKHYMTMFLKEAFSVFKEENQELVIGFSKFCSLRPKNVLLLKNTPSDQCKCKVHENLILKLKALKYSYSNSFWEKILCDVKINSACWQNRCEACCDGKLLLMPANSDDEVAWKCWENSDHGLKLSTKEGQVGDLFEATIQDLPSFKAHVNLKRIQSAAFENDRQQTSGIRILQIDFAMSFSCEYQNEIMSAMWSRVSVLLFTAALFFKGKCQTFLVCSDTKNKDKNTIFTFIDFLYNNIFNTEQPNIEKPSEEVIWSDGPASEFKNRYMAKVLNLLSQKYGRTFSWKYFATSHGKGVVDGVGGNVKRLVREKMMSQGESVPVVQSAKDFADLAAKIVTNTRIFYVDEEFINKKIERENPWMDVPAIPGISLFHIMKSEGLATLCKNNALSSDYVTFGAEATAHLLDLAVNQWVIVNYQNVYYRGEITEIYQDSVKVNVMHESKVPGFFRWPKQRDEIPYSRSEIMKIIPGPVIANNRGLYKFIDN